MEKVTRVLKKKEKGLKALILMVLRARLELAHPRILDFESNVSTNSTTGANFYYVVTVVFFEHFCLKQKWRQTLENTTVF